MNLRQARKVFLGSRFYSHTKKTVGRAIARLHKSNPALHPGVKRGYGFD